MEVFVAIILLFGALSLGSATHKGVEAQPVNVKVPAAVNDSPNEPGGVRASANDHEAQLPDCMLTRHDVIYRDLSRAHGREIDSAPKSAVDCDDECSDE